MSKEQLEALLDLLPSLSELEQAKLLEELSILEHMKGKEEAQTDFMAFVKKVWPDFISGRHHKIMADAFERVANGMCKRLIICLPPRHALKLDTPIPTPDGWTTIADIKEGDKVFGPDGAPVEVLGASEIFKGRTLYRVATDDGAHVDVDEDHLWTVRLDRKYKKFGVYTTKQLWLRQQGWFLRVGATGTIELKDAGIKNPRLPRLPEAAPAIYTAKPLPIDPYVLGVWLGDGHTRQATIACADSDAVYIRKEFEKRGFITTDRATYYSFGVLDLKVKLRELGVLGRKYIPDIYLQASPAQRRDLLKGLMDTDGNVSKKGQCFFAQSERHIIDSVRELLWSLGIKNSVSESIAKIGDKEYGPAWKVSFYASDIAMLPRKEERTLKTERTFGRYITITKLNETADTRCIRVDRPDGLFLAGKGYIVTHNTKSEFASFLLPAWFLGKFPNKKIIQASHTAELAVGFGRKVRNLIDTEIYKEVFDNVSLQSDSKAAGRWGTNHGGTYFAIGASGSVSGKGADLLVLDDVHSEQEAIIAESNPDVFDKVYDWFMTGPRQRLQPSGSIVIVNTRWSKRDLTGRLLKDAVQRGGDEWELIEFPALFDNDKPLWPEFWKKEELLALRASLPMTRWSAQYLQNPTSDSAAIVKREWWKRWEANDPPHCTFVIQSWDTAFLKHERADYSACTTWGVFFREDESGGEQANIILLDALKDRWEFPDLKSKAFQMYKDWSPDAVIVEAKAAGAPLVFELRRMGVPVQEFTPSRGADKIARLNAVADIFASGRVWAPNRSWAEMVIEEVGSFPSGEHDDLVDTVSQALLRFRKGGFISLQSDEVDIDLPPRKKVSYY